MRGWVRRSAAILAAPLIIAGLTTTYVKVELAEPDSFADRAVDALRSAEVREVIAEQVVIEAAERDAPELIASRPLVLSAVEAVLDTRQFARIMRRAVVIAHRALLRGERDVIVEIEEATNLLLPTIRDVSPEIAARVPSDLSPQIAEIRRSDVAGDVIRTADGASAAAVPLLLAAAIAIGLAFSLSSQRARATTGIGLTIAGAGAGGLVLLAALRAEVISGADPIGTLSSEDARAAAGAVWDELAGGLAEWLGVCVVAGLVVSVAGVLAETHVDRRLALRRLAEMLAGGRLPAWARVARGLTLALIGALVLLRADPVYLIAVAVLGGGLAALGLAEALAPLASRRGSKPRARLDPKAGVAIAAVALAVAAGAGIWALTRGGPVSPPAPQEIEACNGSAELCDRRLDQVALAGTHNSMAAADRPGWFFANQLPPIPEQLGDGIRLLMLDPHYGIADSRGRVRTDLGAEGTSRNRVAERLGAERIQAAEALVGRLGLVPVEGEREVFLCHTLCELGAERMGSALDEIRGFLEQNRSEVLILFLESSVDAEDVEREFEEADLIPYLAELERGGQLPTLAEMVASGRRLVVFDQGDGGDAPWYHAGFVFLQDTRNENLLAEPHACEPARGTPESPLLLMNHWVADFPPSVEANAAISDRRTLLARAESCRTRLGRGPNLIAVDFYERGEVLAAVAELNSSGALTRR